MVQSTLATPDIYSQEHSEKVTQFIRQRIEKNGGAIPFANFMQLALYAPGLGYYSAGKNKLGREGDFATAPEISPLFSQCIANQAAQILKALPQGDILEFGAGSGKMAAEILLTLEKLQQLPEHYYILEVSADLQARQRQYFQEAIPALQHKIIWLESLPTTPLRGVILANEVLDAMPVHHFKIQEQNISEFYVKWEGDHFAWQLEHASSPLFAAVKNLAIHAAEYESEISLLIPAWLKSVSEILSQGLLLIIDYGFPRHEYYHSQRDRGTLMCHFKHQAHDNPLILPGIQDITAHVDFTLLAEAGKMAGFEVQGYTNQANFLLSCRLTDMLLPYLNTEQELTFCNQVKTLTLPQQMGELFKAMALTKEIDFPLLGFTARDLRAWLNILEADDI